MRRERCVYDTMQYSAKSIQVNKEVQIGCLVIHTESATGLSYLRLSNLSG